MKQKILAKVKKREKKKRRSVHLTALPLHLLYLVTVGHWLYLLFKKRAVYFSADPPLAGLYVAYPDFARASLGKSVREQKKKKKRCGNAKTTARADTHTQAQRRSQAQKHQRKHTRQSPSSYYAYIYIHIYIRITKLMHLYPIKRGRPLPQRAVCRHQLGQIKKNIKGLPNTPLTTTKKKGGETINRGTLAEKKKRKKKKEALKSKKKKEKENW